MMDEKLPFHATGWQSQKVPTYNMEFVEIGKRKRQIQRIYDQYIEQKVEHIRVGLVSGEWGLGKTHLFLHLIKKIFENSKDCLPLYVNFEKDLRPAGVLDIEEDDPKDFSNKLYQSAISSVKKYEENLKIPYSTQLPSELLNQIDDLSHKNASEIYAEIRKHYNYVYIFIDELEDLISEDDESITRFLEMIIKKNVEGDLSVKDRITFILGCTGPIWNAIKARYAKVRPETKERLDRRVDIFKLEPLTYGEAVELIKEIVTKADEHQQNPFTNRMIRTLWRASNGSPPSFLHLYNIVGSDAIRNAKKGENVIIDYNQIKKILLDELIYVGKDEKGKLPAIFSGAYEDIENILPPGEGITEGVINSYHNLLELMTTNFGEWKKDELLKKTGLDEDIFYKIVRRVNDLSQKRYNQPIFVEVRISNIHDDGDFQNKLRERFRGVELLSPEGKIFGLSYKRTPEQEDIEGADMQSKIAWLTDDNELIFALPKDVGEFCKLINLESTEELESQYNNLMERDIFEKDEYYRLSTFVERRLFPTLESKLYMFIQSFPQQKEVERKIDETFYGDPKELAKYALTGLKEYILQETKIVDENEMPFLAVDGDDDLYNVSIIVKIFSRMVNKDDVSELCRNIEENADVGIILYQTSEDVKSILRKEDVNGIPAGNRILRQNVTPDVIKILTAWGYCSEKKIDINEDRLDENKGIYLHDLEFDKQIKEWVNGLRNKKVGVIVDYKSGEEKITDDLAHWRYGLLEYPKWIKISHINDYPLYMGYPPNASFEKRKSILKNLSEYGLVEVDDSLNKYKIIQTDYEAYVCHLYLEKKLEGRNINLDCFICANTNYSSGKILNQVVLPMLIEKGIMREHEGGYDFRCASGKGVLNILDNALLKEVKEVFDKCDERDKYGVRANDFEPFVIENLQDEEKESNFEDRFIPLFVGGVEMAKRWKPYFSWSNLRAKFNELLEKIEEIRRSKEKYIHKLEELYEESKRPGYNSLKKTKEFMSHVSELTAPYQIIESRIYPQAKSFSEALSKVYEEAKEIIEYIHEPESVSIIDKKDVAKNYYKNGQFEQLEKIYTGIKKRRELLKTIEEEKEETIEKCKEKLYEASSQISGLKEQVTSKFKISNPIVDDIQESVDTIEIEKRIDTTIQTYASEEKILEKLGEEKEGIISEITDYQDLLNIVGEMIPIEEQILKYKDLEEVNRIIEKLGEETTKEATELKNKIEEKISEYDAYEIGDINSESLNIAKEKLNEIKEEINRSCGDIKRLFEDSYNRIEREKELIKNFLDKDEKTPSNIKEQIYKELEDINEDESINECNDKLMSIFKEIEKTTEEVDIHVYRIIVEKSEMGEIDFNSAVQKISDELGLGLEKVRSRIAKLIENGYVTAIIKF